MRFLAVDWGTTNRRVFVIEDDRAVATERDTVGALAVPPGGFPAEIARLRARHGIERVVLAGMVGSDRGWVDAGYLRAPADLAALAGAVARPLAEVAIVPGVSLVADGRGDVMRGEEVQLLGLADGDPALACLPGTHCKWARLAGARLERFVTTMPGELFALLRAHALIGREMTGEAAPGAAFDDGLAEARRGDLLAGLFGVRPARLLGLRAAADAASFVSGLLIGTDVAAHVAAGETVTLVARGTLAALYARAIEAAGATVRLADSEAAFVTGITRIATQFQ